MESEEYKRLQTDMTDLLLGKCMCELGKTERSTFAQAVLACKSILREYYEFCNLEDVAAQKAHSDLPCRVGDIVYEATPERIFAGTVRKILYETDTVTFDASAVGQSVFFSAEDAREKMRKMRRERKDNT